MIFSVCVKLPLDTAQEHATAFAEMILEMVSHDSSHSP